MSPSDPLRAGRANPPSDPAPAVTPAIDAATRARAEKAAVQFEGYLIHEMLKQARSGLREFADEPGRPRSNEEMQDIADRSVADALASTRAFGIADALLRQVLPAAPFKPVAEPVAQSGGAAPASAPIPSPRSR